MEKIKELALSDALTSAYLLLQDIRKLKTSLALELQVAQRCRADQEREFRALMNEFEVTLREIQMQFGIERRLLDLIQPESGRMSNERTGTNA
jgi:hypothetical protein